jgi:hypothetical protein
MNANTTAKTQGEYTPITYKEVKSNLTFWQKGKETTTKVTCTDVKKQNVVYKKVVKKAESFISDEDYFLFTTVGKRKNLIFNASLVKSTSISIKNNVTDYTLENNSKVQDHVSISPLELTFSVSSYKYVDKVPSKIEDESKEVTKLEGIVGLIPNLTLKGYVRYIFLRDIISGSQESDNFFTTTLKNDENIYTATYKQLYNASKTGLLLTARSVFGDIRNLVITSVSFSYENEVDNATIEISLKQLNFANRLNTNFNRSDGQKTEVVECGLISGRKI